MNTMTRITIPIDEETRNALRALARHEMREARFQAGILLREALERRGLLKPIAVEDFIQDIQANV